MWMSSLWHERYGKRRRNHSSEAIMPQVDVHYKSYGCANGWVEEPKAVATCIDANHILECEVVVRDLVRYWCATCKITWSVVGGTKGVMEEW